MHWIYLSQGQTRKPQKPKQHIFEFDLRLKLSRSSFSSFARSQMAPRKRARLSEDSEEILEFEDIFAASDAPVEQQIVEWESWRQKVGVRKPSFEKIEKKPSVQSTIACQRKWHYYTDKLTHKSWILTPFLTSAKDHLS